MNTKRYAFTPVSRLPPLTLSHTRVVCMRIWRGIPLGTALSFFLCPSSTLSAVTPVSRLPPLALSHTRVLCVQAVHANMAIMAWWRRRRL